MEDASKNTFRSRLLVTTRNINNTSADAMHSELCVGEDGEGRGSQGSEGVVDNGGEVVEQEEAEDQGEEHEHYSQDDEGRLSECTLYRLITASTL